LIGVETFFLGVRYLRAARKKTAATRYLPVEFSHNRHAPRVQRKPAILHRTLRYAEPHGERASAARQTKVSTPLWTTVLLSPEASGSGNQHRTESHLPIASGRRFLSTTYC